MTTLSADLVVDGMAPREPAPDGRLLSYVLAPTSRTGDHLDTQVRIADGTGGSRRVTADTATESRPRWSADAGTLYFLSDRAERGVAQLQRLDLDTGTVSAVTGWRAGIDDQLPLADPGIVALIARDEFPAPRDPVVAGQDEPVARLRLLDPRTGNIATPEVLAGRHVVELRERPDGGSLAVLTRAAADRDLGPRSGQLHLVDPVTGVAEDLGPVEIEARSLAWWPAADGWHLGWVALTPPGLQAGTAVFDLALGSGVRRNRTAGLTMCPTDLCQTGTGPLVVLADGLDTALARLGDRDLTVLARHPGRWEGVAVGVTGHRATLGSPAGGERLAVVASSRYRAADVYAGPPAGPLRRVTDTWPALAGVTFGTQEPLVYRAADGLELAGLLVLPVGRTAAEGPFPLVTVAHGGPYDRHADRLQVSWDPGAQWLATAGYAVFLPNPRGSRGRGHEFAAAVAGRVGREEWTDILAGIDLLVARGVADPARLGIAGWSHGGFLAAWAAGQTDRFRAAVVGAGVTDWGMLAATGENGQFEAALGGSTGWEGIGPHPHDAVSPISYAGRIRTPILILHGAEDANVPVGQAVFLHRALRHAGVAHEFVVYPREGHAFRERRHQLDVLHRTRAWFDRFLTP